MQVSSLRELLFKLAGQYRSLPPQQQLDKKLNAEFLEMLMAVHYQNMMYTCRHVQQRLPHRITSHLVLADSVCRSGRTTCASCLPSARSRC